MDDNSVPNFAVIIKVFASQPKPYALLQPKLMPMPPHRAGDRPDSVRQLFVVKKAGQESAVLGLPLVYY